MIHPPAESGRRGRSSGRPPLLLRLLPVGFALAGLFVLAEGFLALGSGNVAVSFFRQEVSRTELLFLVLPRSALMLCGAAFLAWSLEHRPYLVREAVIGLTTLLFVFAMAGACLVGYPPRDAWLEAGWPPLVTTLALAALFYGSGDCGRYLEGVSRPRLAGLRSPG